MRFHIYFKSLQKWSIPFKNLNSITSVLKRRRSKSCRCCKKWEGRSTISSKKIWQLALPSWKKTLLESMIRKMTFSSTPSLNSVSLLPKEWIALLPWCRFPQNIRKISAWWKSQRWVSLELLTKDCNSCKWHHWRWWPFSRSHPATVFSM